jgi:hypothetical protein
MLVASEYRAKAQAALVYADQATSPMLKQQWAKTARDLAALANSIELEDKAPAEAED